MTVLPVPGGPWISDSGDVSTDWQARIWGGLSGGRPGAERTLGTWALIACCCTSCPSSLKMQCPIRSAPVTLVLVPLLLRTFCMQDTTEDPEDMLVAAIEMQYSLHLRALRADTDRKSCL